MWNESDFEIEAAILDLMEAMFEVIMSEPELSDVAELVSSLPQEGRNEVLRNLVLLQIDDELKRS